MRRHLLYILFTVILSGIAASAAAQKITGIITDSLTNEPLLYVTVQYEGKGVGTVSNNDGYYEVETRRGWYTLTYSAIGYDTKQVTFQPGTREINVQLKPSDIMLGEVVVKPKREHYSRRNNPAVDFMRKVIARKRGLKLEQKDYYSYYKYEKMKTSLNNVTAEKMEKGVYKKFSFFKDQVEESPKTGKMILPISVKETNSRTIYRKSPESKKEIIEGMTSNGIDEFFNNGGTLGTVLNDVFTNINIYDDNIRLLQQHFVSPIGSGAISFYQFYLVDTIMVDKQMCVHLNFVPQNSQDFGFTGHIYVAYDSTYAVKRCTMNLPKKTGVNFVDNLDIEQNYEQLPDSTWVLTDDDMTVELSLIKGTSGMEIERTTKYTKYDFDAIEPRLFRLKGDVIKEADMMNKSDEYWADVRQVPLTKNESTMDVFMNRIEQIPGFKYMIFGAKAVIQNFVEVGGRKHPSKFDIGPINTMVTSNYVNGLRLRLSGLTTGNLSEHWLASGYGAYGFKDKKWFYQGQLAYSFNKRDYVLWEFPQHYVAFRYQYDVMSPMDKYLATDKDNMFVGWRWTTVDQMSYIRDAELSYVVETNAGLSFKAIGRHRNDQPTGALEYWKNDGQTAGYLDGTNTRVHDITTTEMSFTLRYAPGETFVNTKQRRVPVSLDAPIYTISHTVGLKGILGGEYNFNLTEASVHRRFWLGSWGKLDATLRAGAQWNKVPFPFLNLPQANLSYINQLNETFSLINNMEFLNDRYVSLHLKYDMGGKLLNRIPLIKKLKWRETFKIRGLWGTLTDQNNPYKQTSSSLFLFPMRNGTATSFVMDQKEPYIEASVGIYNIFKLLHVEYVRRLTYTDLPGVKKGGIRFMVMMTF